MHWKNAGARAWAALRPFIKIAFVAAAVLLTLVILVSLSGSVANVGLMAAALAAIVGVLIFIFRGWARVFISERSWQIFGSNLAARLLGLGVVTYLFPKGVVSLFTAPVVLSVQLISDLSQIVKRLGEHRMPDAGSPDQIFARAAWVVESVGVELSKALTRLLEMLPLNEVIFALALWILIGQLLSGSSASSSGGKPANIRIVAFLKAMKEPHARIAALAVLFVAGTYMSTAAIVAIPWMQADKGQTSFTSDRLEKALEPLKPKPTEADPTPTPVSEDQFKNIETAFLEARSRVESDPGFKQATVPPAFFLADVGRIVSNAKQNWDNAVTYRNQLRDEAIQKRRDVVREALVLFEGGTAVPINSQERAQFFHDIQRLAHEQVQETQRLFRECDRKIAEADKQLQQVAAEISGALKVSAEKTAVAYSQAQGRLRVMDQATSSAVRECNQPAVPQLYVAVREPGQGWGPFAVVARWLLRTHSQELALITGMFGFGLLGSAVVTFVRPRPADQGARKMFGSVSGEVASIIARGLSAAIVVFLTVKGGLAVFAGNEAQPNAYVLFFTCLVGAVFSEDVWAWARKKLAELFKERKKADATEDRARVEEKKKKRKKGPAATATA